MMETTDIFLSAYLTRSPVRLIEKKKNECPFRLGCQVWPKQWSLNGEGKKMGEKTAICATRSQLQIAGGGEQGLSQQ
jgi:hypothetical protein